MINEIVLYAVLSCYFKSIFSKYLFVFLLINLSHIFAVEKGYGFCNSGSKKTRYKNDNHLRQ